MLVLPQALAGAAFLIRRGHWDGEGNNSLSAFGQTPLPNNGANAGEVTPVLVQIATDNDRTTLGWRRKPGGRTVSLGRAAQVMLK
jgi:hypothetical protein